MRRNNFAILLFYSVCIIDTEHVNRDSCHFSKIEHVWYKFYSSNNVLYMYRIDFNGAIEINFQLFYEYQVVKNFIYPLVTWLRVNFEQPPNDSQNKYFFKFIPRRGKCTRPKGVSELVESWMWRAKIEILGISSHFLLDSTAPCF